jgi:hypothetical protein
MTTRNVDALVASIRHLIEALIAQDQKQIGVHESVMTAQADLRDALLGTKESAQ